MQIAWCPLLVKNYVNDLATANWCDMTGMCTVHILRQFWQHNHNVWLLVFLRVICLSPVYPIHCD